jgi:hypothetical protein
MSCESIAPKGAAALPTAGSQFETQVLRDRGRCLMVRSWFAICASVGFAVSGGASAQAFAPPLTLAVAVVPGRLEARVDAAPAQGLVGLVLGQQSGSLPLPGGRSLGIADSGMLAIGWANAAGVATVGAQFPINSLRGATFLLQAWSWNTALPLGAPNAVAVSAVFPAQVPPMNAVADVFVLFGQSNAEGHADANGLPAALLGPQPRCRMFEAHTDSFTALEQGVNTRSYGAAGWCGPELTLAAGLSRTVRTAYLIKFAFPGTTLGPAPGPWNEWGAGAGELYALLLARIAAACTVLQADGLTPRVRCVFMMQGESDATSPALAQGYEPLLRDLIHQLRTDLMRAGSTTELALPFVVGVISGRLPAPSFPGVAMVRSAQLAAATLPGCAAVDTAPCSLLPDQVHFDQAGVLRLGAELARALAMALMR